MGQAGVGSALPCTMCAALQKAASPSRCSWGSARSREAPAGSGVQVRGAGLRLGPPPRHPRRDRCLPPHPRRDGRLEVGFVLLRAAARCSGTMSLCRAASQALASRLSRAPAAAGRLKQRAPPRQMSSGSVPGSSRDSMMIYLLAGVAAFGGLFYAYRLVSSSRSKFVEHSNILHERTEGQKSNPWSRKDTREISFQT
uniref:protein MGARP n=1 Tax=Lonchura striata TaxID=40157 RepID=UPI000B4D89A9|nr:protein MGARP [Lonchura striata domestica]